MRGPHFVSQMELGIDIGNWKFLSSSPSELRFSIWKHVCRMISYTGNSACLQKSFHQMLSWHICEEKAKLIEKRKVTVLNGFKPDDITFATIIGWLYVILCLYLLWVRPYQAWISVQTSWPSILLALKHLIEWDQNTEWDSSLPRLITGSLGYRKKLLADCVIQELIWSENSRIAVRLALIYKMRLWYSCTMLFISPFTKMFPHALAVGYIFVLLIVHCWWNERATFICQPVALSPYLSF